LNPYSPEIIQSIKALKDIDFELAYLALLTADGIKPLSRWEKSLDDNGLALLGRTGLLTKQIRRTVKTGNEVIETIFSRTPACVQLYEQRFSNTPIDKSADTQRFEGFLFGYPPCCINDYILDPYASNNLPPDRQKMLFHWACKDCKITPFLINIYESVYIPLSNY
jgi:hypothetical protein